MARLRPSFLAEQIRQWLGCTGNKPIVIVHGSGFAASQAQKVIGWIDGKDVLGVERRRNVWFFTVHVGRWLRL